MSRTFLSEDVDFVLGEGSLQTCQNDSHNVDVICVPPCDVICVTHHAMSSRPKQDDSLASRPAEWRDLVLVWLGHSCPWTLTWARCVDPGLQLASEKSNRLRGVRSR